MADGNGGGGNGGSWHVWLGLIIALISAGGGYVAWEQRFFSQRVEEVLELDSVTHCWGSERSEWLNTGIRIKKGYKCDFEAKGFIHLDVRPETEKVSGPGGFRRSGKFRIGEVIGRIGETNPTFKIGKSRKIESNWNGELHLMIYDTYCDDNDGKYKITVTVVPN